MGSPELRSRASCEYGLARLDRFAAELAMVPEQARGPILKAIAQLAARQNVIFAKSLLLEQELSLFDWARLLTMAIGILALLHVLGWQGRWHNWRYG